MWLLLWAVTIAVVIMCEFWGIIKFVRITCLHSVHKMWLIATDRVAWSVCLWLCMSVPLSLFEPCKNDWNNRDADWRVVSCGHKEQCIRWGPDTPKGKGNCSARCKALRVTAEVYAAQQYKSRLDKQKLWRVDRCDWLYCVSWQLWADAAKSWTTEKWSRFVAQRSA